MRSGLQRGPEAEGVGSPFRAPLRRERVGRRRSRVAFDLERWRDRLDRMRSLAWVAAYRQWIERFARRPPPRGVGIAGALLFLALALGYGAAIGGHVPAIVDWLKDTRDQAANAAGFRIAAVALTGRKKSAARRSSPSPASPATRRCCSSTPRRRARGLWPIRGSPMRPCSSSIRGRLQIEHHRAPGFRALAEGRPRQRDRRRRHRARAVRADRFATLPLVVGDGAERARAGFSRPARPLSR